MRRTILALAAALVCAATLAQNAPAESLSLQPPPGALLAPGASPALAFFTTGDVVGFLDPCG
ncbi:MAG TPA: hypothetical protein VF139_08730 [Candidatus Polarisedimenticolaceae bacterium]